MDLSTTTFSQCFFEDVEVATTYKENYPTSEKSEFLMKKAYFKGSLFK